MNLNLKYYLIVKNGVPDALLKKEIATMFHQLSISEEYLLHIWKATGIDRKPTHFLRCKSSCTFYGNGWGVTVTFCPDAVLRVTGWVGMETFVAWDTGAPFIITTGTPPLLFTPKRSKIKFERKSKNLKILLQHNVFTKKKQNPPHIYRRTLFSNKIACTSIDLVFTLI